MNSELEAKIRASLVDGRLPCPVCFQIAQELNVSLKEVGEAVDALKIRVSDCQLGLFSKAK